MNLLNLVLFLIYFFKINKLEAKKAKSFNLNSNNTAFISLFICLKKNKNMNQVQPIYNYRKKIYLRKSENDRVKQTRTKKNSGEKVLDKIKCKEKSLCWDFCSYNENVWSNKNKLWTSRNTMKKLRKKKSSENADAANETANDKTRNICCMT